MTTIITSSIDSGGPENDSNMRIGQSFITTIQLFMTFADVTLVTGYNVKERMIK